MHERAIASAASRTVARTAYMRLTSGQPRRSHDQRPCDSRTAEPILPNLTLVLPLALDAHSAATWFAALLNHLMSRLMNSLMMLSGFVESSPMSCTAYWTRCAVRSPHRLPEVASRLNGNLPCTYGQSSTTEKGRRIPPQLCCTDFESRASGFNLHYNAGFLAPPSSVLAISSSPAGFSRRSNRGREMDFRWARLNKFLLVVLVIAVAIVGVLTTVVVHQQHDQSTVNGQVRLGTTPTAPAASAPAGTDIMANSNAMTHPNSATTPEPANAPLGPASQPAPASPAPPVAPALVTPTPRIITPAQQALPAQKLHKPTTLPHRRADPVSTPSPSAAAHPVPPAPQTDANTPAKSDTPVKPGAPDGW